MANENPNIEKTQKVTDPYSRWRLYSEEEHLALVQEIMTEPAYKVEKGQLPFENIRIKTWAEIIEERAQVRNIEYMVKSFREAIDTVLHKKQKEIPQHEVQEKNKLLARVILALSNYKKKAQHDGGKCYQRLVRKRKDLNIVLHVQRPQAEKLRKEAQQAQIEKRRLQRELAKAEEQQNPSISIPPKTKKHVRLKPTVYHIKKEGVCIASGYLNEDYSFVIKEKSQFNTKSNTSFYYSALGLSRQHFIRVNCIQKIDLDSKSIWCILIKDTQCKSAKIAASYMLGQEVEADLWVDEHGVSIVSHHPQLRNSKGKK